jgi:N6-L-threonylcarbamoyladenine synthase
MLILGIETSCDETAAAVVQDGCLVKSNILVSQEDIHSNFGGVVPELACRRHVSVVQFVVEKALEQANIEPSDLSAIAVTQGPGLIGALLVGVCFAKGFAYQCRRPLIGVNHLEGHVAAIALEQELYKELRFPLIALVVSGGHTNLYHIKKFGQYRLLGKTLDDAAGEAFDKAAKMLGLGYPGGPVIDKLAKDGDADAIPFPRPDPGHATDHFSFSGLKTALKYYLERQGRLTASQIVDIAAGFQQAIVDVLVRKSLAAAHRHQAAGLVVVGGVAANSVLRKTLKTKCEASGLSLFIPPPALCTDNGAMIAAAAFHSKDHSADSCLSLSPKSYLPMKEIRQTDFS